MVIWRNLSPRCLAACLAALAPRAVPTGKPPAAAVLHDPVPSSAPRNQNAGRGTASPG